MSCSLACHDEIVAKNVNLEDVVDYDIDWKIFKMIQLKNKFEAIAGSIDELENFYKDRSKTVFDFDLNNIYSTESRRKLLHCIMSLSAGSDESGRDNDIEILDLFLGSYDEKQRMFIKKLMTHLFKVCTINQFTLKIFDALREFSNVNLGNCLLPFASLINHSCDPNIFWILMDTKFVFIVAKTVKAGDQLFQCYG